MPSDDAELQAVQAVQRLGRVFGSLRHPAGSLRVTDSNLRLSALKCNVLSEYIEDW